MSQITIIVEFENVEGAEAEFRQVILDHARRTLNEEPGCLRFEVIQPIDENGQPIANRFVVNELYENAAAVAAHGANPRMATLRQTMAPLLKSRRRVDAIAVPQPITDEGMRPEELNAANDD